MSAFHHLYGGWSAFVLVYRFDCIVGFGDDERAKAQWLAGHVQLALRTIFHMAYVCDT